MKNSRFVKVMLVLIALLLLLNCANDMKPSSVEAQSRVRWEYIITVQSVNTAQLNELGDQGWEVAAMWSGQAVLKRRKN